MQLFKLRHKYRKDTFFLESDYIGYTAQALNLANRNKIRFFIYLTHREDIVFFIKIENIEMEFGVTQKTGSEIPYAESYQINFVSSFLNP